MKKNVTYVKARIRGSGVRISEIKVCWSRVWFNTVIEYRFL